MVRHPLPRSEPLWAMVSSEFLDALVALREGRVDQGRRHLQHARNFATPADADLAAAMQVIRGHLAARDLLRLSGAGLIAAGLALLARGHTSGHRPFCGRRTADSRRRLGMASSPPDAAGETGMDGIRLANPTSLRESSSR